MVELTVKQDCGYKWQGRSKAHKAHGDPVHSLQLSVYLMASDLRLNAISHADCDVTWPLSSTLSIAYSLGPGYSCCFNLASAWCGCGTAEGGPYLDYYPALLLSKPMGASHLLSQYLEDRRIT